MDHSESFYYYALSQKKELWLHDVALFSGENDRLWSCVLSRNENTTPQIVTLLKKEYGRLSGDRDLEFSEYIKENCKVPYQYAPAHMNKQRAGAVAALGMRYFAEGRYETAEAHKPEYLRLSQAERERNEAEAKNAAKDKEE